MKTTAIAIALALTGCAAPTAVTITEPFNAQEAAAMLRPGPNTITGSALIRQAGGGIVTCAGNQVNLIPATSYARRRIAAIYGSRRIAYGAQPQFTPDVPEYRTAIRSATCNAQGFFRFDHLADGEFFLQTAIVWSAGRYDTQGGALIGRTAVSGGQTVEVTLSP